MRSSGEHAGLVWEVNVTDKPTRYGINHGRVYYLEIKKVEHHDNYTKNQILYRFENGWATIKIATVFLKLSNMSQNCTSKTPQEGGFLCLIIIDILT